MRRGVIPLICDPLPEFIEVGGVRVSVEADFRRWIMVLQALEEEIPPSDKAEVIIGLIVKDELALADAAGRLGERFYDGFFAAVVEFLSCGKVKRRDDACESGGRGGGLSGAGKSGRSGVSKEREFDFAVDCELIFASFWEAYGIDLDVIRLHWWKFCALLSALPESTVLMRVIGLRRADLGAIQDDVLRKKVRRAKAAVRIRE